MSPFLHRITRIYCCVFQLLVFQLCYPQGELLLTDYLSSQISVEDGLSSNLPSYIYKDSQGLMWIGTAKGLNRYDAYEFQTFYHNEKDRNSISDDNILTIFEDSHGMIWVGTMKGGLNRYNPEDETFQRFPSDSEDEFGIRNSQVWSICEGPSGFIWFTAHLPHLQSVYKIDPISGLISCPVYDPIKTKYPLHIHSHNMIIDSKKSIWIGYEKGVLKYDSIQKSFEEFTIEPYNNNSFCQEGIAVHEDLNGMIWIGTFGGGLYKIDQNNGQLQRVSLNPFQSDIYEANFISVITEDDRGNLILRTEKGIEFLNINSEAVTRIRYPKLEYQRMKAIYWDRSGLLWFGAAKTEQVPFGIEKIQLQKKGFKHITSGELFLPGSKRTWINSISQDIKGHTYFGGSRTKLPGTLSIPFIEDLSDIFHDSKNRTWIGNWRNGDLYKIDSTGHEIYNIPEAHKLPSFRNATYESDKQFIRYDDYEFSGAGSMRIHELEDGNLLIARGTGLDYFNSESGRFWTIRLCPDSIEYHDLPVFSSIVEDKSGNIGWEAFTWAYLN